jgi:DNA-directed RNA polymerase subunit RPC12/RpoP
MTINMGTPDELKEGDAEFKGNFVEKYKCGICRVHYAVYTDEEHADTEHAFCPECGIKGGHLCFSKSRIRGFIFEHVGPRFPESDETA